MPKITKVITQLQAQNVIGRLHQANLKPRIRVINGSYEFTFTSQDAANNAEAIVNETIKEVKTREIEQVDPLNLRSMTSEQVAAYIQSIYGTTTDSENENSTVTATKETLTQTKTVALDTVQTTTAAEKETENTAVKQLLTNMMLTLSYLLKKEAEQ
jgi:hypothetical protein